MKSPEQGGWPEQSKETERKITTPKEAAEMTRQRRKEYGLGESGNLTPEKFQEIERAIEELLVSLDGYDYDSFDNNTQEEWYWAELEANTGKDRELALVVLRRFIDTLRSKKEETL